MKGDFDQYDRNEEETASINTMQRDFNTFKIGEFQVFGASLGHANVTIPITDLPVSGALKHDGGKPDFSHISYELMETVARVREFGARKYSRNNWKKGFKVTRSIAAALRHIVAFGNGQTNDPESGLTHLGHAVCCLEHAIYDMAHHPENDDRGVE